MRARATRRGSSSDPGTYCTGDGDYSTSATTPTTTTFVLRSPVATQNPLQAPVIGSCQRQFFGWNDPASLSTILDGSRPVASSVTDRTRYQPQIAETFHRWTTLCTIPGPIEQGDYYLQVRTNRPYGGSQRGVVEHRRQHERGRARARTGSRSARQVTGDPNYVSVGLDPAHADLRQRPQQPRGDVQPDQGAARCRRQVHQVHLLRRG